MLNRYLIMLLEQKSFNKKIFEMELFTNICNPFINYASNNFKKTTWT